MRVGALSCFSMLASVAATSTLWLCPIHANTPSRPQGQLWTHSCCLCSFADLAKVLEPGKASKTDKAHIISDAIRIVTQLRGENGQLRQLNKFLEVGNPAASHSQKRMHLRQAHSCYLHLLCQPGPSIPSSHMSLSHFWLAYSDEPACYPPSTIR